MQTYLGNTWIAPKPHETGDLVEGYVNWDTGEMRSAAMINHSTNIGRDLLKTGVIAFILGLLFVLRRAITTLVLSRLRRTDTP